MTCADDRCFRRHPGTRVQTPGVPGLDVLNNALLLGQSIVADHTSPIRTMDTRAQRLYCQTAGSSGAPKTIRRTPASWIKSFDVTVDRHDVSPRDRFAVLGGLGHSLALYGVVEALHIGADVAVLRAMGPRAQFDGLATFETTVLYATPAQLRALVRGAERADNTSMRWIFSGGGKLGQDTRSELDRHFPRATVVEFFGASETSFMTMTDAATPEGSVGRPYPGVDLRITPISTGGTGEIWVRSPYLFDGYEGAASPDTRWEGGFLTIGETGYVDDRGNLFLTGRKNRMFTVADQNVFPQVVETLVETLPGVRHCAVLSEPDRLRGQVPICFVEKGDAALSTDDILRLCRAKLTPAEVPRRIVVLDDFPLLEAGKPDLARLGQLLDAAG